MPEPSLDEIQSNLRDARRLGVRVVDFTGGEPLLYSHIVDALRIAKRHNLYTSVTTNCLLYPRYATELTGLVDVLQFSFESVDRHVHDRVRGVASFDKVIESIDIAKRLRQKVYLIHTVTNGNISQVPEMVQFAQENRCVLSLNPCFEYFGNDAISKHASAELRRYFNEPYVFLDPAELELIERGGNQKGAPVCRAVSSSIVISPDNYLLLPCYHHAVKRVKIEGKLHDLYLSDEVREMMKQEGRLAFCDGCTINCYMKGSLYRQIWTKYFYLSMKGGFKYLRERLRKQF